MNTEKTRKITSFLREQIARSPQKAQTYTLNDRTGKMHPNRDMYERLEKYAQDFLDGNPEDRLIMVSGLRGTGKTTLFAQIFSFLSKKGIEPNRKLFISLDQVFSLNLSLADVLSVFEQEILGTPFEALDTPVFLLLDEIQYDKNWAITIKTIYDRTNKVCVFATGSSSLALRGSRVGSDIARRAQNESLLPMSFTEYIKIKHNKDEENNLGKHIRDAFTQSKNAEEFLEKMQHCSTHANTYLSNIEPIETMSYIKYGNLPFILSEENEQRIYQRIREVIDKIVGNDISMLANFDIGTITKVPELLYTISNSDNVVVDSVAKNIDITRPVVTKMLELLEKTGTLLRILPYGSTRSTIRKPSKYTFISSSYRATLFHTFGTILNEEDYKGNLLEDVVALYLYRIFVKENNWSLAHDISRNGADFIVSKGNKSIIIEAGFGSKNVKQVKNTMQRVNKNTFGIIISSQPLGIDKDRNVVNIPIELFLLL